MINEANGTPSHTDMIKLLLRAVRDAGAVAQPEWTLPNGKIADICYATQFDGLHIVEVKTTIAPHLFTRTFDKYANHCHYLWLAAPEFDPALRMPEAALHSWSQREDRIGLLSISWSGAAVIRPARLLDGPPINGKFTLSRLRASLATGELALTS